MPSSTVRRDLRGAVDGWVAQERAFEVVCAAADGGLFDGARSDGSSIAAEGQTGTLPVRRQLESLGVLVANTGGGHRIAADFEQLNSGQSIQSLSDILAFERLMLARLRAPAEVGMATASGRVQLIVARNAGAMVPLLVAGVNAAFAQIPGLAAVWSLGGRHLELGCGVGCQLLSALADHPAMTGVGVELSSRVVEEARTRAESGGFSRRVEIRCANATDLDDEQGFDTALWSQPFFEPSARDRVLAAARRALRPGGLLVAPMSIQLSGDTPGAAMAALWFASLAAPPRSLRQLKAEFAAAGFSEIRTVRTTAVPGGSVLSLPGFVSGRAPGERRRRQSRRRHGDAYDLEHVEANVAARARLDTWIAGARALALADGAVNRRSVPLGLVRPWLAALRSVGMTSHDGRGPRPDLGDIIASGRASAGTAV